MRVSLVVAAAANDVIGRAGVLPWHLPEDLTRFKRLTTGHAVVVGRRTHESIVERLGRPLPDRVSVVLTRRGRHDEGQVHYRTDIASALAEAATAADGRDEVFVIGGAQVYAQALPTVTKVYLTRVHGSIDGDASMPEGWLDPFDLYEQEVSATGGATFQTCQRS